MSVTLTRKQALLVRDALEELETLRADDQAKLEESGEEPEAWLVEFRQREAATVRALIEFLPRGSAIEREQLRMERDQLKFC